MASIPAGSATGAAAGAAGGAAAAAAAQQTQLGVGSPPGSSSSSSMMMMQQRLEASFFQQHPFLQNCAELALKVRKNCIHPKMLSSTRLLMTIRQCTSLSTISLQATLKNGLAMARETCITPAVNYALERLRYVGRDGAKRY